MTGPVIGSLVVAEVGHIHRVVVSGLDVRILMGGNTSGFYPSNTSLEKRLFLGVNKKNATKI